MFYNPKLESIQSNSSTQKYVSEMSKEMLAGRLEGCVKNVTTNQGKYLRTWNGEVDVVEEAISRAPMFANVLKSRGYKNILFVGHFNDHQTSWILDKFAGRMIDLVPEERGDAQTYPDLNVVVQFIPVIMKEFGYEDSFTVARPSESKHQGVMHEVYSECGVPVSPCGTQYKHGHQSFGMEHSGEPFDAVVFLGVPMSTPDVGFEEDLVRSVFAPMCTEDFEMVDLYYGAPSSVKWQNGEEKSSLPEVQSAFTTRVSWDHGFARQGGSPEEFDIMARMFTVY